MVEVEELTYEKIHRLKAEQDKLVIEGKMEYPQIIRGFSAEERMEFNKGIPMEEVFDKLSKKYNITI